MKVVLYARVSTTRQAERDLSIPDQLRQLRQYCVQRDHEVAKEFREEGASATDANRPSFKEMFGYLMARGTGVEAILVLTTSRFFRDIVGARKYKKALKKVGVQVISITQEVSNRHHPTGSFIEGIFELQDQYESDINAFHTLRGMVENARRGYFNGSTPPFGYCAKGVLDGRGNKKTKLAPDEGESKIIRHIFDLYVNGDNGSRLGLKRITEILNQEGNLKRGRKWSKQAVQQCLSNRLYIGDYYFNRRTLVDGKIQVKDRKEWIKIPVKPLIGKEIFDEAVSLRKIRQPTSKHPPSVTASRTLLTGILHCGRCGSRMVIETAKNSAYRYYNCSNYIRRGRSTCKGNRISEAELDSQILNYLSQKFFTRERIREIIIHVNREISKQRNQNSKKLMELRTEHDSIRARIRKYYEAIESGSLDLGLVSERLKELKVWEAEISEQLERFQRPKQLPPYLLKNETLKKIQARLEEIFMSNERGMAKEYLKFFLKRIEIKERNINLKANTIALCNFSLMKKTEGTANVLTAVPPVVMCWLPSTDSNRGLDG